MFLADYFIDYSALKHRFSGVHPIFCLIFLSLINACRHPENEKNGYSSAFYPIVNKVNFLYSNNKNEQGIKYLDSAFKKLKQTNNNDKFRLYYFHYVYWETIKNDHKKAILYADSMLQMANKGINQHQYTSNFVEANFDLGDSYFSMEKYDVAYHYYFKGYLTGRNSLNNTALSNYNYRMGMIMYKQGQYKIAVTYFKVSYKLHSDNENKFSEFYRKQELLTNIGLSFSHSDQPDSAIIYFNKALALINKNAAQYSDRFGKLEEARGVVYGDLAEVLTVKKKYDDAIRLLKKGIAINLQKDRDNFDAETAEIKLARIYLTQNKADSLFNLLSAMRPQLDSVKNENAEINWNRLISWYYAQKNDPQKALNYLQVYNVLQDEHIKKLNKLKESDVNEQLSDYEKQYQINVLINNNKIQRIYLYVAVVGACMCIIIIFLILRNWKRSRNEVGTVNVLNKQINEQKNDLEETLDELNKSSLEKDRILRTVTHDLRNPIGGIASLTALMEEEDGYTNDQKQLLKLIKDTSQDTILLINEILEVTQHGSGNLKKQLVEINSLLNNSVELLRFKAAEKNQQIMLRTLDTPEELWISREKIWRVISNLISNAIKFSPDGAVIAVEITSEENDIQITVNDHGIGIPNDIKDKVFNIFTEAKRNGTAGEKSFGLGLSICRQIIETHHGKLWFDSDPKNGTTFYVRLSKPTQSEINS